MTLRAFAAIILGLTLIGFALGLVTGMYIHLRLGHHYWAYISVPLLGIGSGIAAYGTLKGNKEIKKTETPDG